tara:strand:+ start:3311 stop:3637 length:327 start_codon:yes stop_codon:yes gene_type:complete
MFKYKLFLSIFIFSSLLIFTSIIKNQTRKVEKKIDILTKRIFLKEKDLNESFLDYSYVTSPAKIEKKIEHLGNNYYTPVKKSKIFLDLSDFMSLEKKIAVIKQDEKKK